MSEPRQKPFGTPGKSGPAIFAFPVPKASLGSSTKAMDPSSPKPSWRSGNTHGFCVTGGHPPIASEPTPSLRLWATAPGATPARLTEHTTGGQTGRSKPELSTLLATGTFYFALTQTAGRGRNEPRNGTGAILGGAAPCTASARELRLRAPLRSPSAAPCARWPERGRHRRLPGAVPS